MAAPAKEPVKKPLEERDPDLYYPEIGDVVLVWHGPKAAGVDPFVGVVTKPLQNRRIECNLLGRSAAVMQPADDCLPLDDPKLEGKFPHHFRYEPHPQTLRLVAVERLLADLRVQLGVRPDVPPVTPVVPPVR